MMKRLCLLFTAALCCLLAGERAALADAEPPNIVFIISDDQSYLDIGYQNDEVATPHLDRLAEQGGRFTRAYNMGSYSPAVCIASRTMLNTGRFLWNADTLDRAAFRDDRRLWSQQMQHAGYRTYFAGKWHVPGVNVNHVFDVTRNVRPGMPTDYVRANEVPEAYHRPVEGQPDAWDPADETLGGFWAGGTHWSEVLADDAAIMLQDAREHDEPFFMVLAFNAPHDPRQSPRDYLERYPQEQVRLPESFLPEYPHAHEIGSPPSLRDEALAPFPRTEYAVRVHRQEYYAIISHMDAQVGRILDALDDQGERDNTWIIFTSDHGLAVGHHGLLGKQNMYEHSLRVPFIVVGPGVPPGSTFNAPIYLQDVMPTTLELAGRDLPDHVQFRSILSLIAGDRERSYPAIYGAYLDRQRAVIEGDHKLIVYPTVPRLQLFDLVADPHELHDLADDPAHQQLIRDLVTRLSDLQAESGDTLDLTDTFPDQF